MLRTGILGALDEEISLLLTRMKVCKIVKIGGISFFAGYLGKAPVVVGKSEVGKVNAGGHAAQILIDCFFSLQKMKNMLNGLAVDAESGAVGQVAFLNRVPYIAIRTVEKFLKPAALRSQSIVLGMLKLGRL